MAINAVLMSGLAAFTLLQLLGLVPDTEGQKPTCNKDPELCDIIVPEPKTLTYSTLPVTTQPSLQQRLRPYVDKHVNQTVLDDLLEIVDNIVSQGNSTSQENTTVLQDVENIVRNANVSAKRYKIEKLENVAVVVESTASSALSTRTLIFKKITHRAERNKSWSIDIFSGKVSGETIAEKNNKVVVTFPLMNSSSLLTAIVYDEASALLREKDTQSRRRLNSVVVNVNAYDDTRDSAKLPYLDVVFEQVHRARGCEKDVCDFWDHNQTDEGLWSGEGCKVMDVRDGKVFCRCTHLTHFGALIQVMPKELGNVHSLVLDIITYLGCLMSLAGVARIVMVAATNPKWRRDTGHKLVLCLAVNVALMTALFLPVATGSVPSGPGCIAIGAGLHYLLLASFMWTLVSAWLQYRRYAIGIYTPMTHLILKMSLISWVLPILPVAVLLIMDTDIYTNNNVACHRRTYCFPTNSYFYVTVALPIGLIILANVFIFIRIVCQFCGCFRIVHPVRGGIKSTRMFVMIVFEFFLLGLPWIFGLMAEFDITFLYLFCITASQHGFILYLFFVFLKKQRTVKHSEASTEIYMHSSSLRVISLPTDQF